jgi:hypothetical protein
LPAAAAGGKLESDGPSDPLIWRASAGAPGRMAPGGPRVREYRLIDADSHTLEPPHIWTSWLAKRFHDRAPKLVKDAEGGDAWLFAPGTRPMEIGLVTTPGRRYEDIKWTGYTYDTIRKSCFEPKARLEDMDLDGIDAAFLYPSQRTMHTFMGNPDREFHLAGVRAYNDWLAQEFCAVDFARQVPHCFESRFYPNPEHPRFSFVRENTETSQPDVERVMSCRGHRDRSADWHDLVGRYLVQELQCQMQIRTWYPTRWRTNRTQTLHD